MNFSMFMFTSALLASCCTNSITIVHTQGRADDVVDETATHTNNTSIDPTLSIPASVI